jgi:hypothetical protein
VRWNRIGDAGLNTSRASVVAHYGAFTGNLEVRKAAEGGELDVVVARGRVVVLAIDSKEWASGLITGKDANGYTLQPALGIFHHGAKWTLVEVGTDQVGCSKV